MSACLRVVCALLHLLACASAPSCNAGYGGLYPAADSCDRLVALITSKPALASVATRANAGVGSASQPVYNASGGPRGKGHVAFDRTLLQTLNAGNRPFLSFTNGGLTIVAVVRFRGGTASVYYPHTFFHIMSTVTNYPIFTVDRTTQNGYDQINLSINGCQGYSQSFIASSTEFVNITVVVAVNTGLWTVTVNGNARSGSICSPTADYVLDVSTPESFPVVGGFVQWGSNYHFTGDIAGLIFTDEILSSAAITQAYSNIVQGIDLTTTCSLANPCAACPAGQYKTGTGTAYCANCPPGTYSNKTAPTCTVCDAGKYSNANATTCNICMPGTYSIAASPSCTACDTGKYSPVSAATAAATCLDCVAGKYAGTSSSTCVACAPGTYAPAAAAACIPCAAGKASAVSLATAAGTCVDCVAGKYAAAATTCVACAPGTYATAAATACTPCAAGKASAVISATAAGTCVDCVAGTYAAAAAATTCVACASGTYALAPATVACAQCRANAYYTTSSITISTGILCDCSPGYFDQPCADSNDGSLCDSSPYFDCRGLGQFNCYACCGSCTRQGTDCLLYGYGAPRTCVACPAGKYDNAASIWTCTDCPATSWSSPAALTPDACVCNAGYTGPTADACAACDAGTYKNVLGTAPCTSCPDNSNAPSASTALAACTCNAGFTGPAGGVCTPCTAGTYKDAPGSAACTCNAGFTDPVGATCTACAPGKYKDAPGSAACVACHDNSNSIAASPARASCTCNAGFEGIYADTCTPCAAGQFKNTAGNDYCVDCAPASFSGTGATACSSCPAYSTSPTGSSSAASCVCNAAYTGPSANACTTCAAGKYKAAPGNVPCGDCPAGWAAAGASACTACPASSASPPASPSVASCVCNAGFTGTGGTCAACAAGKYKEAPGSAACTACTANRGATCVACTLALACTCNAGYVGGNFLEPFTTTACARFVALIIQRPAFASVATRNNATIGSAFLPTYDPNGGPNGYGHLSFDRALAQSVAYGPRAFRATTNGGFTIVAVFRLGVEYITSGGVILDATFSTTDAPLETPDAFKLWATHRTTTPTWPYYIPTYSNIYIVFDLRNPGYPLGFVKSMPLEVSDDWMSVVVTYVASTNVLTMSVNDNPPVSSVITEGVWPDALFDRITVGDLYTSPIVRNFYNANPQLYSGDVRSYGSFHGDIAGLFVVDELLSTDATTAVYENIVVAYDFTIANCTPSATCAACAAGKYKNANGTAPCLNCKTGTNSGVASQTCPDCPASTYATPQSVYCLRCPLYSSSPIGSANISACSCRAGYGGNAANGTCTKCAAAAYKPSAKNEACTACPAYSGANCSGCQVLSQCLCTYVAVIGENRTLPAAGCLDPRCNAAYAGPDGGPCVACVAGKYKTSMGSACTACPAGTYQNRTASTACVACHASASSPSGSVSAANCTCNPGYTRIS